MYLKKDFRLNSKYTSTSVKTVEPGMSTSVYRKGYDDKVEVVL